MKTGRNEPCPCGSGKKYKKCCLEKDQIAALADKAREEDKQEEKAKETGESKPEKYTFDPFHSDHEYQAQKSYPTISEEESLIVDEWWESYKTMEDTDIIREHLENFMYTHPRLVENLELDSEVLFELGAAYRREDRFGEYISLLLKIREQFPETYLRSAGYYDADIIAWLVSVRRTDEVPQYLNYLITHPVDFVEQSFDVCNLLMAVDATKPLLDFVSQVRDKITSSDEIIGGNDILLPLIYDKLSAHIRADYSEHDIDHFVRELREELLPEADADELKTYWVQSFADIMRPYTPWQEELPGKAADQNALYFSISDHFMRYLHEEFGLSWVSAQFHSGQIYDYGRHYLEERKGKKHRRLFDFSADMIDTLGAKVAQRDFMFLDTTLLISLFNAIHYFADYLVACSMIDEMEKQEIQAGVKTLYGQMYPKMKDMEAQAFVFSRFPFWG